MKHVDITETTTHLSLCSGYSGIGLGLKGIFPTLREIAHVEIEAYAIANLVAKMEEFKLPPAPIFTNLKTFPFASFRGCVDIISGGFPCQPFSTAGKRKASEDPRHLFPYIKDGIAACRPRLVFLENVEGIISAKMPDGTSVLKYVLTELESVGYKATAGVFSAAEVGASHQRKRVFILGVANSCVNERWNIRGQKSESKLTGTSHNGGTTMADSERERSQRDNEAGGAGDSFGSGAEVWGTTAGHCDETLVNPDSERQQRSIPTSCNDSKRWQIKAGSATEHGCLPRVDREAVADTDNARQRQGNQGNKDETPEQPHSNHVQPIARPGEEQFSYEEPRTKPKLGRAANGASSRVDRLRACGNGVVPATAEKAFKTLINRLT